MVPFGATGTTSEPSKGPDMDPEPLHAVRRQPFLVCGFLLLLLVLAPLPGRAQPSGGPYGPIQQRYEIPKAAHVYYVAPDGKAEPPGTTLERADDPRGGDRAGRDRRRDRDARRRLPHGRPDPQPGHHAAAVRRRTADPQGHASRDEVGGAAQQRVEDLLDAAVPGRAPGLVAARPRGHADAAAPLQQRHGVRGRRAAEVGGLGGRARRALVLHRLRGRPRVHRRRSHAIGWSRSPPSTARSFEPAARPTARTSDRKGPVIRGITFTQYAYRALEVEGKKPRPSSPRSPLTSPWARPIPPPSARRSWARCSRT